MTTSERRRLRALAEQFPAAREALLSLAGPRRSVKAAKKERLAAKKESRAQVTAETRAIREVVMTRADGRCDRCGTRCPASEAHLHHLFGGSGRRRVEQSPANCAALCAPCHEWIHRNPSSGRTWATGYMALIASIVTRAPRAAVATR